MECLKCGKETLNENQICDECAQIEAITNESKVTEVQEDIEVKKNNTTGIVALVFGIVTLACRFLANPILSILSIAIPMIGTLISSACSPFVGIVQFVSMILAITMGGKAKNTDGAKLGKIGRTLGFVELGILIAEIALIINDTKILIILPIIHFSFYPNIALIFSLYSSLVIMPISNCI